jgi:hypothetical protein
MLLRRGCTDLSRGTSPVSTTRFVRSLVTAAVVSAPVVTGISLAAPVTASAATVHAASASVQPDPPGTWCNYDVSTNYITPVEQWFSCKAPVPMCTKYSANGLGSYGECPGWTHPDQIDPPNGYYLFPSHVAAVVPAQDHSVLPGTAIPLMFNSAAGSGIHFTFSWTSTTGSGSESLISNSSATAYATVAPTSPTTYTLSYTGGVTGGQNANQENQHWAASSVTFTIGMAACNAHCQYLDTRLVTAVAAHNAITGTTVGYSGKEIQLFHTVKGHWSFLKNGSTNSTHKFAFTGLPHGSYRVVLGTTSRTVTV